MSVIIPGKKYGEDADQQISFPVQCSFWALADSTAPSNKTTRNDSTVLGTVVGHSCLIYITIQIYWTTALDKYECPRCVPIGLLSDMVVLEQRYSM